MVKILLFIYIFGPFFNVMLFHLKNNCFLSTSLKQTQLVYQVVIPLFNNLSSAVYFMIIGQILME